MKIPSSIVLTLLLSFGCTEPRAPAASSDTSAQIKKPEPAPPKEKAVVNKLDVKKKKVVAAEIPADVFERKGQTYWVKESFVRSLENKPEFVLKQARIVPSMTPDGIDGMRLMGIEDGSFFSRAGFQNDDVIKSALGQELTRPDHLLGMPSRIKEAGKLDVVFTRQGKTQNVSFRVKR